MIHDAAAKGYERGAADYEKGRPGYPRAVLDTLVDAGVLGDELPLVVDLAAGTGKFTRLLFEVVPGVVAVEPVAAMREAYARNFPGERVLEGTAEDVPLPDQSVDVVTVAQAFHWFDWSAALDEVARVVRSGGWLVLVWNTRDERVPWAAEIVRLMDRLAGSAPRFRSPDRRWREAIEGHGAFDPLSSAAFDNPVPQDRDTMLARVASTSYVSALPDRERAAVLAEVTAVLERGPLASGSSSDGSFVEPYRTELFWCRRR